VRALDAGASWFLPEQGRRSGIVDRRHFHLWTIVLALCLVSACASPKAPPPTPGDCTTIRLWTNGFHVNLAMGAELFEEAHPLRKLFPDATHFLIGWGERDFYIAAEAGVWLALKAITPPSPAVMQVIAAGEPVEDRIWPGRDVVTIAISETGAKALARSIADHVKYDDNGEPIVLARGRVEGGSLFLAARGGFHLFNMCNHWTAARLREAGIPVSARISFTAGGLMRAAKRKTEAECPTAE
jgi:uncharacterized protein (TIGR02117 family)